MDATAKVDLYLLTGGKETDDYTSRRLACSEARFVKMGWDKRWFKKDVGHLALDIQEARLQTGLLIPGKGYRVDFEPGTNTLVYYYRLLNYTISETTLRLTIELL